MYAVIYYSTESQEKYQIPRLNESDGMDIHSTLPVPSTVRSLQARGSV